MSETEICQENETVLTPLTNPNVSLPESLGLDPNTASAPDPQFWREDTVLPATQSMSPPPVQGPPNQPYHQLYYPPRHAYYPPHPSCYPNAETPLRIIADSNSYVPSLPPPLTVPTAKTPAAKQNLFGNRNVNAIAQFEFPVTSTPMPGTQPRLNADGIFEFEGAFFQPFYN
jgi:hypothetical protein